MEWYIKVVKDHYFDFKGRAQRKELWMFILFNAIFSIVFQFLDQATGNFNEELRVGLLGGIYALVVLLPGLGVQARRLHDIGKSGWFLLLAFIPLIGVIILIVWYCQDGQPEPNEYGVNPKFDNDLADDSDTFFQS